MNFEAIKSIYLHLTNPSSKTKVTYFRDDDYQITWFWESGAKSAEIMFRSQLPRPKSRES